MYSIKALIPCGSRQNQGSTPAASTIKFLLQFQAVIGFLLSLSRRTDAENSITSLHTFYAENLLISICCQAILGMP